MARVVDDRFWRMPERLRRVPTNPLQAHTPER